MNNDFVAAVRDETGIEIGKQDIKLPDDQPATESLVEYIRFLFQSDILKIEDLPIESGQTRYLINTNPTHKDETPMKRPNEAIEGVFIERNYNVNQIKKKIRDLSKEYGGRT